MSRRVARFRARRIFWVVTLALLASAVTVANAADPGALYRQGSFEAAYRQSVTVDSAAMQTLAAQAAIARGLYQGESEADTLAWLRRGQDAAEEAAKLAGDSPAALLALAQAKGEIASRTGPLANLSVPGDIGGLLKRAVKLAPQNPDALVGLGLWNLELTDRGVGWMFGARRDGALAMVAKGVGLAPQRPDLRVQYARALTLVGDASGARKELQKALTLSPANAVQRYEQRRAAAELEQMGRGGG